MLSFGLVCFAREQNAYNYVKTLENDDMIESSPGFCLVPVFGSIMYACSQCVHVKLMVSIDKVIVVCCVLVDGETCKTNQNHTKRRHYRAKLMVLLS